MYYLPLQHTHTHTYAQCNAKQEQEQKQETEQKKKNISTKENTNRSRCTLLLLPPYGKEREEERAFVTVINNNSKCWCVSLILLVLVRLFAVIHHFRAVIHSVGVFPSQTKKQENKNKNIHTYTIQKSLVSSCRRTEDYLQRHLRAADGRVKILHFLGVKPWQCPTRTDCNTESELLCHSLVERWWRVWDEACAGAGCDDVMQ